MSEPTTTNVNLIVPTTGDLSGTWGSAAMNPNFTALDGLFGGVTTISLSSATSFTLTNATGTVTAAAGPYQAQNAVIVFSGTLTGNAVITLPSPGKYIVRNNCTVGNFYVQLKAANAGTTIGAPDGRAVTVWNDGTNCDFSDPPEVGTYLDLAMATTPVWFAACSTLPYLLCDGTTYTSSIYPALSNRLGSTFGGNGSSTFAVPDAQQRVRISIGTAGVLRVTSGTAGFSGSTVGATGGNQNPASHTHTSVISATGHFASGGLPITNAGIGNAIPSGSGIGIDNTLQILATAVIGTTGTGSSGNVQPTLVAGICLIKT